MAVKSPRARVEVIQKGRAGDRRRERERVELRGVVINAGGKTYDFRVDARGRFHLCPAGRGRPPRQSDVR